MEFLQSPSSLNEVFSIHRWFVQLFFCKPELV